MSSENNNTVKELIDLHEFLKEKSPSRKSFLGFNEILEGYKNGSFEKRELELYNLLMELENIGAIIFWKTSDKYPKMATVDKVLPVDIRQLIHYK